jgi:hypothetical protein
LPICCTVLYPDKGRQSRDIVVTARPRGTLFPSRRHTDGINLVIFPANLVEGDQVAVHDPDHRLPHDQSSWS